MRRIEVLIALAMTSCVGSEAPSHDEPSDFDPVDWTGPDGKADFAGIPATFDRNDIMEDVILTADHAVTSADVQAFLEYSPYGTRSWLADVTVEGAPFSQQVVAIAGAQGIDPVVLLARMQVESSLVSATVRPSQSRIDTALGCGCPDSGSCSATSLGLAPQLRCAAQVLSARLHDSQNATGEWIKGKSKRTYDPLTVTPRSHATAALYAYTPWVLPGKGGNWLVWNVTRKFLKAFDQAGTLTLP